MRGRIAGFLAAMVVATGMGAGIGGHRSVARANDTNVTEVAGGGYGVAVNAPGITGINPTPAVEFKGTAAPGDGVYGYASDVYLPGYVYDPVTGGNYIPAVEVGKAVVTAAGSINGDPYAFADSRVSQISVLGVPELTFYGIKTFCEWDNGDFSPFGMTFVYYEGGNSFEPVVPNTDVPLADGGHYVLNEQILSTWHDDGGDHQVITVNGLHAYLPGGVEIVLAASVCDPNRIPLLGAATTTDARTQVAPAIGGFFDPWNNILVAEDCGNGVDDNGNGLIDAADPGCAPPPADCEEDGVNHLYPTVAGGLASAYVHYFLEPPVRSTGAVALADAVHEFDCSVVVPTEDAVDAVLPF